MLLLVTVLFLFAASASAGSTTIVVRVGHNESLSCFNNSVNHKPSTEVCWRWSGMAEPGHQSVQKEDGSLLLQNVTIKTSGNYTCFNQKDDTVITSYKVLVPGPPSGPTNLTATELDGVIILRWRNTYDRDYLQAAPDTALRIHYRPLVYRNISHNHYKAEPRQPWRVLPFKLEPVMRTVVISEVKESSNYQFELWAQNRHGTSSIATITTTTKHSSSALHTTQVGGWEHNKLWLLSVVSVLAVLNLIAGITWLLHCDNNAKKHRRRHRAIGNHSGMSGECEQLELVCHAHDSSFDGSSLTLPHHAALV